MTQTELDKHQARILLIHPQTKGAETLYQEICALNADPEVLWVHHLQGAIKALSENLFNLIILNLDASQCPVNQTIDELLSQAPGVPLVMSCDKTQELDAQQLLSRGLMDYLIAPRDYNKPTLERVLRYSINQQLNEEAISKLTQYDLLTGVANRYLFRDRLSQAVIRAQRSGITLAVFIIDLDQFHAYNNQKGYQLGDQLLKEVAKRIVKCVRRQDTVARLSGDEFSVVLEGLKDPQDAGIIAKEMSEQFAQPTMIEGEPYQVTLSIGVTVSSQDVLHPDTLIKQADIARYRVKESGGNNFEFFSTKDNTDYETRHLAAEDLTLTLNRIFSED